MERISKKFIWVSHGVTSKPFNTTAVIQAEFRGKDMDLDHFISDHLTLQAANIY